MKANQEKCHFLSSLDISKKVLLSPCILETSGFQKLAGVAIDIKLRFRDNVTNLCDKTSKKIQ